MKLTDAPLHSPWKGLAASAIEGPVKILEDKAEGLFQYARLLEGQLAQQKSRNEGGKVKIEELDGLPQGLGEMYDANFRRVFEDEKDYESSKNVIAAIVASTAKVPQEIMRDAVLGKDEERLETVKVGLVGRARLIQYHCVADTFR